MIFMSKLKESQQLLDKIQHELDLGNRIFLKILDGVVKYFSTNINDNCLGLQFKLYCLKSGESHIVSLGDGEEIVLEDSSCATEWQLCSSTKCCPNLICKGNQCQSTSPGPAPGPPAPTPACPLDASNSCHNPTPGPPSPGSPTPKSPDAPTYVVGQWLENASPVGTGYNMITNGLMQGPEFYLPAASPDPSAFKSAYYRFATYGGDMVPGHKFPDIDYVFTPWANANNCGPYKWEPPCGNGLHDEYNGIDFDMEGPGKGNGLAYTSGIPTNLDALVDFIGKVKSHPKAKGKQLYFQITINGNFHNGEGNGRTPGITPTMLSKYISHFDFVALMLYGAKMEYCDGGETDLTPYGDWCVNNMTPDWIDEPKSSSCNKPDQNKAKGCGTSQYMKDWIKSAIPNNKLVLCMAKDATSAQVKLYSDIVKHYNLAGIAFWKGISEGPVNTAVSTLL